MRNFRTLQIAFRCFVLMALGMIVLAAVRLHVFGLDLFMASPYAILAYVGSLMGLMALTLLFRIMLALEGRGQRRPEPTTDPYDDPGAIARLIRETRAREARE